MDAEYVSMENIIEPSHVGKAGLNQEFYDYLAKQLAKRVKLCGSKVPVITGKPHLSGDSTILRRLEY